MGEVELNDSIVATSNKIVKKINLLNSVLEVENINLPHAYLILEKELDKHLNYFHDNFDETLSLFLERIKNKSLIELNSISNLLLRLHAERLILEIETLALNYIFEQALSPKIKQEIDKNQLRIEAVINKLEEYGIISDDRILKYLNEISPLTAESPSKEYNFLPESFRTSINNLEENLILTARNEEKKLISLKNEVISSIESEFRATIENTKVEITKEKEKFDYFNKEIREQLNLVTNETLSNKNIEQAKKEKTTADFLRIIGTVWLAALAIYAATSFHSFFQDTSGSINFGFLLIRWLVIFLMTLPGIYLLKESARHREDERRYSQLGVQLATINSYLESFDSETKNRIKQELVSSFFGYERTTTDTSSVPDLQQSFDKTLDAVISIAKKGKP